MHSTIYQTIAAAALLIIAAIALAIAAADVWRNTAPDALDQAAADAIDNDPFITDAELADLSAKARIA